MRKQIKKALAVIMTVAMAAGMVPTSRLTDVEAATTRYESEDDTVCDYSHARKIHTGTTNASGKKAATMYPTEYVVYTVNVEKAGTYDVIMNVAVNSNPAGSKVTDVPLEITTGEGTPVTKTVTNNKNYNSFTVYPVSLELEAGANQITVKNVCEDTTIFVNLDYIEIEEIPEGEIIPDAIGTHEAEKAEQVNFTKTPESGSYYSECSGQAIVGVSKEWIGNNKKYISQKVNAAEAGKYQLTLQYCAPGPVEFLIQVNNGEWTYFDDVADVTGHVSPSTDGWNKVGTVSTVIELAEGVNTVNISGPVVDNSSEDGNYFTVFEKTWANATAANLDCFIISEYTEPATTYTVTLDGVKASEVEEGGEYTIPSEAAVGYVIDGSLYKGGEKITVNKDIAITSVNEVSVSISEKAGIRLDKVTGIRYCATMNAPEEFLALDTIAEGTLIVPKDIYTEELENNLDLTSTEYAKVVNVVNSGWYNNQMGIYCGSLANLKEYNYSRDFIARAYVTYKYADGETVTVYSNMSGVRSVRQVAQMIIEAGYPDCEKYKELIDMFASIM